MESMEKIRQGIDSGILQLATMGSDNQPHKVDYEDVRKKVDLQQRMADLGKELLTLSWEEKYEWVNIMKLKGNRFFSAKEYNKAIEVYLEALIGLDLSDKSRIGKVKEELQMPILINIATCYYMLAEHHKGLAICNKVLQQMPRHAKALYKKGVFLRKIGRFQEAKNCWDIALKQVIQPDLKSSILTEYEALRKQTSKEQIVYKRMFETEELSQTKNLLKPTQSHYYERGSEKSTSADDNDILNYDQPSMLRRMLKCLTDMFRGNWRSSLSKDD